MESTAPLHQVLLVRKIVSTTSHTPPRNRSLRNHHSLPDDQDKIGLHLQAWANVVAEPHDTVEAQRHRIDKILNFFINVGTRNELETTPAVKFLQDALSAVRRGDDFSRASKVIPWHVRISQLSVPRKTDYERLLSLKNLCLHGIPLFNIWDSMSFIYTVCVQDIKTQLGAELYLYQFRMIVQALRDCMYFHNYAGPTTVAASWTEEAQNKPLMIAFATTCVGPRKNDNTKELMNTARQEFMKTITDGLKNVSTMVNPQTRTNRPGKCPEYLTWPIVCRQAGRYKTLCFTTNIEEPQIYRCCEHCERTLKHLGANDIRIDDIWQTSLIGVGPGSKPERGYEGRRLNDSDVILKEYGGLKNV